MASRLLKIALPLGVVALAAAYALGAYSQPRNLWPLSVFRQLASTAGLKQPSQNFDAFGRLTKFAGKVKADCPTQGPDTGVLLAFGQSNSANHGEKRIATQHPRQVVNYFDGSCYVAGSPLLGASGEEGEFLTSLADKLIEAGTYKTVVIVSSGIGSTPIARWQQDGDLNDMLLATLKPLQARYKVTDVVWHQGESDWGNSTSAKVYRSSFASMARSLETVGVKAPVFIAVASKCFDDPLWVQGNPTANGQRALVDGRAVFLGADTDMLLQSADRRPDKCHLSESGQRKVAGAYAAAIAKHHAAP